MKIKLSICMIVKNEEANLLRLLESIKNTLKRKDVELIIVDTGSTDNTLSVAKRYTKSVYSHEWNHSFSDMRNISISYAKGEWIAYFDADEEVEDELYLIQMLDSDIFNKYSTIQVLLRNFTTNDTSYFSSQIPLMRFFKRTKDFKFVGTVHNQPIFSNPIYTNKKIILNHYGYNSEDKELMERKFNRTKTLLVKELDKDPNNIYYRFQLAQSYNMYNDLDNAYKEIKSAYELLSSQPNPENFAYVYQIYVNICSRLGKDLEVLKIAEEGYSLFPDFIDLYYVSASTKIKLGYFKGLKIEINKYLDLFENLNDLSILQNGSIELFRITPPFRDKLLYDYARVLLSNKSYESKEFISKVSGLKMKTSLLASFYVVFKDFPSLVKLIENNDNNEVTQQVEGEITKLTKEEREVFYGAFSKINNLYGVLNGYRIDKENLPIPIIEEYFKEIVEHPVYWELLEGYLKANPDKLFHKLKSIKSLKIKEVAKYLIYKVENMELMVSYIKNKKVRNNDIQGNRVFYNLIAPFLIENKVDKDDKMFKLYIEAGVNYVEQLYNVNLIRLSYKTIDDLELKLFMIFSIINKLDPNDLGNYPIIINLYKEMLSEMTFYARYLEDLIARLESDYKVNLMVQNERYKKELMCEFNNLVKGRNFNNARNLIGQMENILGDGPEHKLLRADLAFKEGQYFEVEEFIRETLTYKEIPAFIYSKIGDLYKDMKKFSEAMNFYQIAFSRIENTSEKASVKHAIDKLLLHENRSLEIYKRKRVLILCHFYSPFVKELIENMYKMHNIIFDLITMDGKSYREKGFTKAFNQIYDYQHSNDFLKILSNIEDYDVINIHFSSDIYAVYANELRQKTRNLLVTIWGSDHYRASVESKKLQRSTIFKLADKITFTNDLTLQEFNRETNKMFHGKLEVLRFGLAPLPYIDTYRSEKENAKKALGISEEQKVVVCGYNSWPNQNHELIIESLSMLSSELLNEVVFVFPLTYGNEHHKRNIMLKLVESNLNYKILEDYLDSEEISKLRIVSDCMVNLQQTDQFSGSMQEHLYADNIVITGDWLPYNTLKEKGVFFLEISNISQLTSKLEYAINNLNELKKEVTDNKNIIHSLSSWDQNIEKWFTLYTSLSINA